jgi:type I restriction enzyme S subunit
VSGGELLPLGEVVKPIRPRVKPSDYPELPFIGMEHVEAHSMKLLGTVPAGTMKSSAVHFKPGDVLYGRLRPYLNKVYRPTFEGLCSAEFIVLPENERVDGAYLQYFLNSSAFVRYASHLNAGDRPRVDFDQLASYEMPLPEVDEQRRIVAEIEKQFSRLDEAVANLKRVKANLKRYKAAVLKAAVEGRLVPTEAELAGRQGRSYETGGQLLERITATVSRSARAARKSQSPGESGNEFPFDLPAGWSVAPIAHLAEVVEYGTSAKTSEVNVGVPVLRMGNIVNGDLDLTTLKYLPDSHEEFPCLLLRPGDLLFNRTNSPELVGKTAVFKGRPEKCSFASYLIRVRLVSGCMSEFVSAFINSLHGRKWVKSVVIQQVGQANVNGTKLQNLLIPLPPITEQERIVNELGRRLSIVGHIETCVDAELQQATVLRHTALRSQFARFDRQGSLAL